MGKVTDALHEDVLAAARKFMAPAWTSPDGEQYCLRGRIARAVDKACAEQDAARQQMMKEAIIKLDAAYLEVHQEFLQVYQQYKGVSQFCDEDWETEFNVKPCQCPGCQMIAAAPAPTMRVEIRIN